MQQNERILETIKVCSIVAHHELNNDGSFFRFSRFHGKGIFEEKDLLWHGICKLEDADTERKMLTPSCQYSH